MNNHPQGVQRNSQVLLTTVTNEAYGGVASSADNIGITLVPLRYFSDAENMHLDPDNGKPCNADNTIYFPWNNVLTVVVVGGNK